MASSSLKKLATTNVVTLKNTHLISLGLNSLVLLILLVFKRPSSMKPYLILSLPSFVIEYILEKNGRPRYSVDDSKKKKLVSSGDDISRQGLYEYFFDVLYITWLIDILMVIFGSNKIWYLYAIIPGYAAFKLAQLILPFLPIFKRNSTKGSEPVNEVTESKRQSKLKARREKGPSVKYR